MVASKSVPPRKAQHIRSIEEDHDFDTAILLSDFPQLRDKNRRVRIVDTICQNAGLSAEHPIGANRFVKGKIIVDEALRQFLPRLYRKASLRRECQGDDWKALYAALDALVDVLRILPDRLEKRILHAIDEVWNDVRWKGNLPMKWREFLEKEYRLPLKRGRRLTRRPIAKRAIEMKKNNPKLSLMQLAQKLCDCGKPDHDYHCKENLRQGIRQLTLVK